ncbi:bifunctional phosphopantothenoylcysteine decarboxylase/phosphopantothenate--cysteine ligase CoaBC [Candidatus Peregrinibacteria bacterium]|nr:MAG: bifunctional phosphopantothenoylcysteine decarboxylase/phosphopantothenate--cysteine ligase CoaBC [Candidatus Peregrinibacteria bacterium]
MKICLLVITGSVAALKAPELIRALQKEGFDVHCVVTKSGRAFITPAALCAVSQNPVLDNEWFSAENPPGILASPDYQHLFWAEHADIILVAPASADSIARLAHGRANGLFEAAVLATKKPVLIAPAMNTAMLTATATQKNMKILESRNVEVLPTESGTLACGTVGEGRLLPAEEISLFAKRFVSQSTLFGKKVLITLGRTEEPLDPVRVLTNKSSGKMGLALAREAFFRGAEVTLISGKTDVAIPNIFTEVLRVETAEEMFRETQKKIAEQSIAIFCAAVADFSSAEKQLEKIPSQKCQKKTISLSLVQTTDIAAECGKIKLQHQRFFGFALETSANAKVVAREKCERKHLDGIFLNSHRTLGEDSSEVFFLPKETSSEISFSGTKQKIATKMWDEMGKIIPPQ